MKKILNLARNCAAAWLAFSVSSGAYLAASSILLAEAAEATPPSRLGDLSAFRAITVDVLALAEKGDLASATKRIKDLEISWDGAEAGLKPRDAAQWHVVDKAIDRALSALRDDRPDVKTSVQSLREVLTAFDAAK